MKTLRKIKKNTKALSPVVASIILIAVTVAVSIAVAAWMGALTIGFMGTEEVKITNVNFEADGTTATLSIKNTGASAVVISEAYVGTEGGIITDVPLDPGQVDNTVQVIRADGYTSGTAYQFKVISQKGNPFVYTATAP
jgi:flagellin-like protein